MENIFENERKLAHFKDHIVAGALDEAQVITDELRQAREREIAQADEAIYTLVSRYQELKQTEISAKYRRSVSAHRNLARHKFLEYREKCADEILERVRKRIVDFVASEDYPAHMLRLIQRAARQIMSGVPGTEPTRIVVYLRSEDFQLSEDMRKAVPDAELAFADGKFTLGGLQLVCKTRGTRVDMSFDAALEDMVGHYSEFALSIDPDAFTVSVD